MVETYSWKSPNCEDLQGQMYRFFLICWPYFVVVSWVIKVVFNWFAFNHEIKDLFWARRRMLFVSIPPLSPVSVHHLEHDLKSRTRRFLRWWERKEPWDWAPRAWELWSSLRLPGGTSSGYSCLPFEQLNDFQLRCRPWKWQHSQKSGVLLPCPLNPSNTPSIMFFFFFNWGIIDIQHRIGFISFNVLYCISGKVFL